MALNMLGNDVRRAINFTRSIQSLLVRNIDDLTPIVFRGELLACLNTHRTVFPMAFFIISLDLRNGVMLLQNIIVFKFLNLLVRL